MGYPTVTWLWDLLEVDSFWNTVRDTDAVVQLVQWVAVSALRA
ncbi:hypothetical protein [Halocatena marina]|uniref:Uncharacterized protein n=1 Tax=Halocatena marina TaxID=2934937 RepID=A0ABD5YUA1_9EURY|nr:hypothetical protein [Halocatena marina]